MSDILQNFDEHRWENMKQPWCFRHEAGLSFINQSEKVLDVGCGDGLFAGRACRQGIQIIGVDHSSLAIEKAHADYPECEFKVCDFSEDGLPYAEKEFDVVMALDVLEHLLQPEGLLAEMTRVSKRKIIIGVPNFSSLPARLQCLFGNVPENNKSKKGHVYWFNYFILKKMLKDNNLKIVELKYNTQGSNIPGIKQLFMLLGKFWPNLFALSFVVLAEKE